MLAGASIDSHQRGVQQDGHGQAEPQLLVDDGLEVLATAPNQTRGTAQLGRFRSLVLPLGGRFCVNVVWQRVADSLIVEQGGFE